MSLLNKRFETPYNTAPFSKIKTEDFLPAFVKAIENAKIEIAEIANSKETPTFTNTIEALDYAGEQLDRISSIFFNLNAAETSESIQKIAQEVSPLLTEFSNDVALNTGQDSISSMKRSAHTFSAACSMISTTVWNSMLKRCGLMLRFWITPSLPAILHYPI